jgi:hypothetical protein
MTQHYTSRSSSIRLHDIFEPLVWVAAVAGQLARNEHTQVTEIATIADYFVEQFRQRCEGVNEASNPTED